MNGPCKDCADRHERCHAECARYNSFKAERNELNQAKHSEYDMNDYMRKLGNKKRGAKTPVQKRIWGTHVK